MAGLNLLHELDLMRWQPSDRFVLGLWFGIGIAMDLLFGLRAWHTLRKDFRRLAVQTFLPEPARPAWWRFCLMAVEWTARLAGRFIPARARKPVFACLAVGVALAAVLLVLRSQQHFPPPVLVSMTQSNAPFQVFPGGGSGVLFIMPDGTLWQWGKPGAPQSPRAVVPEQIGTAHDWVKVVGAGTHCLGLRADGTIWGWGFSNGRYSPEPQPAIAGNDWIDLGTGSHHAAAIKRDGTLWTWNEPLVANDGKGRATRGFFVPIEVNAEATTGFFSPGKGQATRIHVNPSAGASVLRRSTAMNYTSTSNWVSVYCGAEFESTFALRKDGTIWAEGNLPQFLGGSWQTVHMDAIQVCAETNWTSLDANGLARNQAGELWDIKSASPNPHAGALVVCSLVSSHWVSDRVHSVEVWSRVQVRANGTLWTAPFHPESAAAPAPQDWSQLGTRSDWVAVWGQAGTGFGLTADGTVWTWGVEMGREPVKTYESRLELLRARLTGRAQPTASRNSPPSVALPRPLLKLVGGKANQQRK
jgi:hypothetical protein